MKSLKCKTWQHETTGLDGNTILFGVNIFEFEWMKTGKKVVVKDPLYGQKYTFPVYKVNIQDEEYAFAAGEFSNSVFGFYIEKY